MSNIHLFRVVIAKDAQTLRDDTADAQNQINPRLVEAGNYAGWYAFSDHVMRDPAFAYLYNIILSMAPEPTPLDIEQAWPVPPEK